MSTTGKSMDLYLYILERAETAATGEWAKCIVAAKTEEEARQIANEECGAEGYIWNDGFSTNAKKIGIADDGVQGVLMHAPE